LIRREKKQKIRDWEARDADPDGERGDSSDCSVEVEAGLNECSHCDRGERHSSKREPFKFKIWREKLASPIPEQI
jgi:hypothetical protein